jgi:hypothetical protein
MEMTTSLLFARKWQGMNSKSDQMHLRKAKSDLEEWQLDLEA